MWGLWINYKFLKVQNLIWFKTNWHLTADVKMHPLFVMSSFWEGIIAQKPVVSRLWLAGLWQGNLRPESLDILLRSGWSFSEQSLWQDTDAAP